MYLKVKRVNLKYHHYTHAHRETIIWGDGGVN